MTSIPSTPRRIMRTLACLSAAAVALALPLTSQRLNEDARRERVMYWAAKATPADCEALTGALTDESYDIRNRAASALYWRCERASAAKFAPQLCRSIELGIAEAGAVLLLGYTRSADAALCLREAASRKEMVKLTLSS